MSMSPEYARRSTDSLEDDDIAFLPLDDIVREKRGEEDLDRCRTPTGEEYRLASAPETCPPAPRKKKKLVPGVSCKKRLVEVDVLAVKFEEVEEWFRLKDSEAKADSKARKLDAGI